MNRLTLASALLLLAVFLAPAGTHAAPYCPNTNTTLDCKKDKSCKCSDIMVGDPVNLADGSSYHRAEDLPLHGISADLGFLRAYDSEDYASSHANEMTGLPKPFGSSTTNVNALKWYHNFFAFVYKPSYGNWWVRNLDAQRMEYTPCSTYWCFAPNSSGNSARLDRLEWTPEGFTLHEFDGRKLFFNAAFGSTHYFLTEILSPSGTSEVKLTYLRPSGCPGSSDAPYLDSLVTSNGQRLSFTYKPLVRSSYPTNTECVLSKVTSGNVSSVVPDIQVDYTYVKDSGGVERPGRIYSATWSSPYDSRSEIYVYDSGFGIYREGFWLLSHSTDSSTGQTLAMSSRDMIRVSWDTTYGTCDASSSCCSSSYLKVRSVSEEIFDGGGNTSVGNMLRKYELISGVGFTGGHLYRRTDSCNIAEACSPGSIRHEWECPSSSSLRAEKGFKNKRDFWEVYQNALPPTGQPQQLVERTAVFRGASSLTASDALEARYTTYSYPVFGNQRPATESVPSVLNFGNSVTTHKYDNRGLKMATYKRGWTVDLNGNRVQRVVATFYREYRLPWACGDGTADPNGRTVTVAGPCEVSDENALQCSGTNFPVTLSYYWQGETDFNRNTNLKKEVRYPNGCSSTPLETYYDRYDASGHATRVVGPDGVATEYVYGVNGMVSKSVGGAPATTHGYDNGALAWIRYPEGNYEVYCHRRNTPTSACSGGTWHPKVQWRAKSSTPDGATWSEKVVFAYWGGSAYPNDVGPLMSETYLSSTGEVRRIKKYAVDGQERPSRASWGNVTATYESYYTSPLTYDGADNLTGVGHPANNAPAWCGGATDSKTGLPRSRRCDALQYDRADRLESLIEYTSDDTSVAGIKTCFAHDKQGNVKTVVPQCQTTLACTLSDGSLNPSLPAACLSQAIDYQYDDFGNLVEYTSPASTGSTAGSRGLTRYTYNAAGHQTSQQTESMRTVGARVEFSTDQLGRKTSTSYWDGSAWKTLYQFFYDNDGGSPPAGCAAPTYTQGRLRLSRDSGGDTWYSYDNQGRLVSELRVRPGATSCSDTHSDSNPHLRYSYTPNGNLSSITYPHGRRVDYVYSSDLKNVDRVDSLSVSMLSGSPATWTPKTLLSNISWEPYGGLRGYQLNFPTSGTTASLEYLLGDNAGVAPSSGCPSSMPSQSSSDWTGRLRALWLSSGSHTLGSGSGDLFKRTYTWQADQVSQINTCVRNASSQEERFGYDRLLRLSTASSPTFSSTGGSYRAKSPSYDSRGNRTSLAVDEFNNGFTYSYSGDKLQSYSSTRSNTLLQRSFSHNRDGRIDQIRWATDSSGYPARTVSFTYDTSERSAGNLNVFRAVEVGNGAFYNYWYDALGRRRLKVHPTDQTEEYFYDQEHHLLEDRGFSSLSQSAPYPLDEYIWLDDRPVALLRSSFDASFTRQPDSEASCQRLGQPGKCGVYFIVSDHIGKAVLMLDGSGRITGTGEYSPFGELNRVEHWAETAHPYANNTPLIEVGRVTQPTLGLSMDVRIRFDMLDTESCGGTYYDPAYIVDGNTNATLVGPFGGHHSGPFVSPWLNFPASSFVAVKFQSDSTNWAPNSFGCIEDTGVNFPYSGISFRAYEYRRYDGALGASPMWTPLRFPGQYHDPETDLFENWNRYYDPTTGRYLQPEPLMQQAYTFKSEALSGKVPVTYTYAQANPINEVDASGLFSTDGNCDEQTEKLKAGAECKEQAKKIVDECMRNCVIAQCDAIKVICKPEGLGAEECKKKGVLGATPQMLTRGGLACTVNEDFAESPGTEVVWCKKNFIRNTDKCTLEGLVHEMAHSCGMKHDKHGGDPVKNAGIPGHEGDGIKGCDVFGGF